MGEVNMNARINMAEYRRTLNSAREASRKNLPREYTEVHDLSYPPNHGFSYFPQEER
jgi:hypothetical protein